MQAEAAGFAERATVVAALKNAAAATGSDFHYLLGTAMRESSLKANAQSSSSSATGLFQFIDQTWLGLVKEHGGQHGLGDFAKAINKDAGGRFHADPAAKDSILALRKDPKLCALMAGEYAKSTQASLRASLGREVCGGELYAAHFLGPDAASKLIKLAGSDPGSNAAAQFPAAAASNKSVFYRADGAPKSVREVYDWALRQPGEAGTVRLADLPGVTPEKAAQARTTIATAQSDEVRMLLSSVMNWQPKSHSLFGNLMGLNASPPASPLSFSPGLLGLLSDAKSDAS